jgi:hypothetical protein
MCAQDEDVDTHPAPWFDVMFKGEIGSLLCLVIGIK